MILFIVLAAVFLTWVIFVADDGIVVCILQTKAGNKSFRELLGELALDCVGGICVLAVVAFIVYVTSCMVFAGLDNYGSKVASQWEFNINALNDNVVTEGEWYGRRGHIDGELSYFYSRTLSYGEKIEHIPADKTYVQYSDTEHPHIEVHQTQVVIPKWVSKVFWVDVFNTKRTEYYVIVVPEGSITTTGQYEIDME